MYDPVYEDTSGRTERKREIRMKERRGRNCAADGMFRPELDKRLLSCAVCLTGEKRGERAPQSAVSMAIALRRKKWLIPQIWTNFFIMVVVAQQDEIWSHHFTMR